MQFTDFFSAQVSWSRRFEHISVRVDEATGAVRISGRHVLVRLEPNPDRVRGPVAFDEFSVSLSPEVDGDGGADRVDVGRFMARVAASETETERFLLERFSPYVLLKEEIREALLWTSLHHRESVVGCAERYAQTTGAALPEGAEGADVLFVTASAFAGDEEHLPCPALGCDRARLAVYVEAFTHTALLQKVLMHTWISSCLFSVAFRELAGSGTAVSPALRVHMLQTFAPLVADLIRNSAAVPADHPSSVER